MKAELLKIAEAVVGKAAAGEQVEVVTVHGKETEIRVYQGEIESFTAAESQGVGIRVVQDGRQGMAYAGSLDSDVLNETLEEARDTYEGEEYDHKLRKLYEERLEILENGTA